MSRDAGTIFIETLVAAAIVALILGMTFRVLGDASGRARTVEARRTALLIAQSRLAATGAAIPLQAGTQGGTEGRFAWRVTVAPRSSGLTSSKAGALAEVVVAVRPAAGGADLVTLRTLRLARPS